MKESKIEKQLKDIIKSFGWKAYSIHGKTTQDNGIPDITCVRGESCIFFETKLDYNKASLEQMLFLKSYKNSYIIKFIDNKWVCINYYNGIQNFTIFDILK